MAQQPVAPGIVAASFESLDARLEKSSHTTSSSLLNRPAKLRIEEMQLMAALNKLSESSGVSILFSPNFIPALEVGCDCTTMSLREALSQLLRGTDLGYTSVGPQIVVAPLETRSGPTLQPPPDAGLLASSSVLPRPHRPSLAVYSTPARSRLVLEGSITGRVVDAGTLQPLAAAQVYIPDLGIGVLTGADGRYLLSEVPDGVHSVRAERLGYRSVDQQVTVSSGATAQVEFSLSEEALALDAVVVTGTPGGTQRRAIGNTVTTLPANEIVERVVVTDFQDLLSGRGAGGVRFSSLSGNVGTGSPITLRGAGSFNSGRSQPLIYVDGVRVNNSTEAGPILSGGSQVSVLNDFNPADIESIEIIKGPAAASLYGTEASAGVIQIITKRGQEGPPQFDLSIREGFNYMPDPAGRLGTMWYCPTASALGCPSRDQLRPYNMYEEATRYIREGYFPWPSENLYSYGPSRGYDLGVRGGGQAVRYYVSASYSDDQGYTYFNTDEALRLRGNLSARLGDYLNFDLSTGYVDGHTRFGDAVRQEGGMWQDMIWSKGYFLNTNKPFSEEGSNPRLGGFQERLPTDHELVHLTRDYTRFTGSGTLNFNTGQIDLGNVTASVASRAVVGIDRSWDINQSLFPRDVRPVPEHLREYLSTWEPVYRQTHTGQLTYDRPITTNLTFDYSVTGRLEINDVWSLSTSLGAQYYTNEIDRLMLEGRDFASPVSSTINQTSPATLATTYSFIEDKSLGFFVQQEVGWSNRLFLTGAMRFDDNSTFGAEAPPRRYPKVSGTWVVSEESFWNFDAVNSLRLRAAWGKAGRQPTAIASFNTYAATPGPRGTAAIRPESPGNPGVEPEVSTELEVGFDAAFLDDRLSGEFTYYWRKDEQLLRPVPVLGSYGIPGSVERNMGRIDNWGWEARVNARLYESPTFSFVLDLSADQTDNEIKDLADPSVASASGGIQIGLPYPGHIVRARVVSADWDPAGPLVNAYGDRISAMCDMGVFLGPHDPNDPNLTREQVIENSKYGRIQGGEAGPCGGEQFLFAGRGFVKNSFTVAPRIGFFNDRLQIFALAEGQYGRVGREDGKAWTHIDGGSQVAIAQDDPVWVAAHRLNGTNSGWEKTYFNADFWKLREIGASFTLPESLISGTPAERASIAISARNTWTIWQAQKEIYGLRITDPELGNSSSLSGSGSFWEMPPAASVHATLRMTF